MANNPNHLLAIHGHFYQPPRENPWLDVIEQQGSATPFSDWNERICAECYTPLTCSPVCDERGRHEDLFNCFAHISFNFGPTLLNWMNRYVPFTLERIVVADQISQETYYGNGAAIAQVYNHQILPLSDVRDRHTQIIWGLKEFEYRFKRQAKGLWLSETAIDMNTIRALIDHGVEYIILSPLQAGYIRKFGEFTWTGVPDGTIDTRVPYRLFEVDGGGRTHFNRYLDIIFYDKELSTKVSFEHLLEDSEKLEWLIRERYNEEATLPQLVLIATDGEIYGHHEKNGNKALAKLLNTMLSTNKTVITNIYDFLKNNPPHQEVRLWEGEDGKGSSWSCSHGVGRWERDCGCSDGPHNWNQQWRTHLRTAFDDLKNHIRKISENIASDLLYDLSDARNDYIHVLINPTVYSRESFLDRHSKRPLSEKGRIKVWKILEAERNAMLMYTSCGWFFSDVSGLEPIQNMRYALRAAELVQEFADFDLVQLLQDNLKKAVSNIQEMGTGADIFNKYVLTSRYSYKDIAAIHALSRLCNLPQPEYGTKIILSHVHISSCKDFAYIIGNAECMDKFTCEENSLSFIGFIMKESLYAGVCTVKDLNTAKSLTKLSAAELLEICKDSGTELSALPYKDRLQINNIILKTVYNEAENSLQKFYDSHRSIFKYLTSNNLPVPNNIKAVGEQALSERLTQLVTAAVESGHVCSETRAKISDIQQQAYLCGLTINKLNASRILAKEIGDKLGALLVDLSVESIKEVLSLLCFIQDNDFWLENWDELLDRFWRILHLPPRPTPSNREIIDLMRKLGNRLYFSEETLKTKTQVLFSTPV